MANYQQFKRCLTVAASTCGVTMAQLHRERSVGDFFIDIDKTTELTPQEIAIRALTTLCVRAGMLDGVIAIAVVTYLDEAVGCPAEDRRNQGQREKDLLQILKSESRTETAFRQWYDAWYN